MFTYSTSTEFVTATRDAALAEATAERRARTARAARRGSRRWAMTGRRHAAPCAPARLVEV